MDFFLNRYFRLKYNQATENNQPRNNQVHIQPALEYHAESNQKAYETPRFNVSLYAAAQLVTISAEFTAIDTRIEFEYDLHSQQIELWVPDTACTDRVRDLAIRCHAWHAIAKASQYKDGVLVETMIHAMFEKYRKSLGHSIL